VTDTAWIDAALTSARPQAVGALLRYFRNLDTAEEAFQNACLRALKSWPQNGPPRDPAAWLIMVGRNVAIDDIRRSRKQQPLPEDEAISDLDDAEEALAERLDGSHYRDDILRLLFICCHPDLPATQQIALALRIVSGLTVKQIARAFLVGEAAMEQRITRAKARVANADVPFETPGAVERTERLSAVAAMVYLIFNEGYSAGGDTAAIRAPLCEEAIRLARLLLRLFQGEPEIMGLTALLLLQHARAAARFDAAGALVLLDDQDRALWNQKMIAEGLALIDKAMRHRRSGPYQIQAAIAALHARAAKPEDTDWTQIDLLYGALEIMQPSPVVTLNRAVAVSKVRGPEAALELIEPLGGRLSNYFHFFGVRGAFLMQLGRNDEARVAFDRAIALANTSAEAAHIRMHLDRLMRDSQPRREGREVIFPPSPAKGEGGGKALKFFSRSLSDRVRLVRLLGMHLLSKEQAMPTIAETTPVSKPALWTGRVLSGLVILFMLFDGAIKLVPWPVVTETMDRIGYGSSETLARSLGFITLACTILYAIPPTSILGAILLTGYLGGAMASHLRIGSPLFSHILFGFYLGLMVWGGLWLRDRNLRALLPLRR
jgi:RNA polymerase sigma-70 factor, ECF subfamily